jgi:uncharacterized membrane protein YjjB (DUF3815 family)
MLARISKALAGALSAGIAALVTAWPDGVTNTEWGAVAAAVVIGFLGVYVAPKNADPVPPVPPTGPRGL